MRQETKYTATIIGPLNIDYLSTIDISALDVFGAHPSPYIKSSVRKSIGGTGFLACLAARNLGFSPHIISPIGGVSNNKQLQPDEDGLLIIEELAKNRIQYTVKIMNGFNTAKVILVYFKDKKQRLMVCDNDVIFQGHLNHDEITVLLSRTDLLYISGYMILENPARNTIAQILSHSKKYKILTLIDLVPHNIYSHINYSTLLQLISNVDILSASTITFKRILSLDNRIISNSLLLSLVNEAFNVRKIVIAMDGVNGYIYSKGSPMRTFNAGGTELDGVRGRGERQVFSECRTLLNEIHHGDGI